MSNPYNHAALLNLQAMTNNDTESLGTITDSYFEGSLHWLIINGDYELCVGSVEVVIDLPRGKQFARLKAHTVY
ncbi:hypothetical protein D3C71_1686710 [compost metagenome]